MESKPIEDYTDSELTQVLSELEEQITLLQHEQSKRQLQQRYYRSSAYLKSQGWFYITNIPNRYTESFWYKVSDYGIRFGYLSNDGFIELPDRLCESADNNIPTPIATYFLHKFLATYSITIHDKEKNISKKENIEVSLTPPVNTLPYCPELGYIHAEKEKE